MLMVQQADQEKLLTLGANSAKYAFYLPNPPLIPSDWHHLQADAIAQLILVNGNHWRKIFTIMAKIRAPDSNWKYYRDVHLLKADEQILIGATHLSRADRHFIIGNVMREQLGMALAATQSNVPSSKECGQVNGAITLLTPRVLVTPYFDYRQYPNVLIEQTRHLLDTDDALNA